MLHSKTNVKVILKEKKEQYEYVFLMAREEIQTSRTQI